MEPFWDRNMKDHPIIFSAPMVLALLDSRKTMTRRLALRRARQSECRPHEDPETMLAASSWQRVQPGDRLWVRENLAAMANWGLWHDAGPIPKQGQFLDDLDLRGRAILDKYAPTEATDSARVPSIYMPRWASRITLAVTATKIERLQEISEADAISEGSRTPLADLPAPARKAAWSERQAFSHIWDALHGVGAWDANPEVVALTFTVHKQNIDTLPKADAA